MNVNNVSIYLYSINLSLVFVAYSHVVNFVVFLGKSGGFHGVMKMSRVVRGGRPSVGRRRRRRRRWPAVSYDGRWLGVVCVVWRRTASCGGAQLIKYMMMSYIYIYLRIIKESSYEYMSNNVIANF